MKKTIRLMATVLLVVMAFSSLALVAEAKWYNIYGSYKYYATCTLTNKNKDGYVNVNPYPTIASALSVKLTDKNGSYIWDESRAITFGYSRTFRLGCDHPVYRVYVKTYVSNGSACTGGTYVSPSGNVSVK